MLQVLAGHRSAPAFRTRNGYGRVRDGLGGVADRFRTPHAKWGAGARVASVAPDLASGVLISLPQLSRTVQGGATG